MRFLPYGDRALLLELDSTDAVVAYADALRAPPVDDLLVDVVPGARTLLLRAAPDVSLERLARDADSDVVVRRVGSSGDGREVEIAVDYDGPDLAEVAELTGLTADEVVAAHTATPWRVAFGGFAPGFAYLVGGDERLHVPRRDEPRTEVPAGAVGLAGEFSGVYPRPSPGGWQLIGSTDAVLWDLDRDPPALLEPGVSVRFVAR